MLRFPLHLISPSCPQSRPSFPFLSIFGRILRGKNNIIKFQNKL